MTREEEYINRVLDMMPLATPMRSQIATELRGHIAERVAHGHSVDDVLRQLGDPVALAESYLAAVPLVSGRFGQRVIAKVVDLLTIIVPIAPLVWLAWQTEAPFIAIFLAMIGGPLLFGIYTTVAEWRAGQTLGKRLLGILVVRETGARISLGQSIVRQLPLFFQFYWIDVLFALFTEKSQRAFELLSKTRVVLASP